ncbi:hypothetical protein, partial [Escherichia coli]|uniref:hypothetical protein n=1 Tax=Escherichia coli TaxID=562 RepID=UPI002340E4E2
LMMNPVPWLQMTNMISYQGLVRTFPNAAFLDGKSFEYKNGETNGETTKMTFFGPSGEVLKFLVNPVNNLYRMGLTSGATFEEINCTEI